MDRNEFIEYCGTIGVRAVYFSPSFKHNPTVLVRGTDPVIFAFNFITVEGFDAYIEGLDLWLWQRGNDIAHGYWADLKDLQKFDELQNYNQLTGEQGQEKSNEFFYG